LEKDCRTSKEKNILQRKWLLLDGVTGQVLINAKETKTVGGGGRGNVGREPGVMADCALAKKRGAEKERGMAKRERFSRTLPSENPGGSCCVRELFLIEFRGENRKGTRWGKRGVCGRERKRSS